MTDQNIEQQITEILDNAGCKEDYPDFKDRSKSYSPRTEAKAAILALISKQVSEAKKDERIKMLQEIDMTTPEGIKLALPIVKELVELKQTPPTPNGDERGGLAKSEEAKSEQ